MELVKLNKRLKLGYTSDGQQTNNLKKEVQRLSGKPVQLSCSFPSMFEDPTLMYHNVHSLTKVAQWAEFINIMKIQKPAVFIAAETWTL